jgi:hypothetical protein
MSVVDEEASGRVMTDNTQLRGAYPITQTKYLVIWFAIHQAFAYSSLMGEGRSSTSRPHHVVMNFQHNNGWSIHFIAVDCKTPLSRFYDLSSLDALRDLVRRTDPPPETLQELEDDIRRWSRGSIHLHLTEEEYQKLKR